MRGRATAAWLTVGALIAALGTDAVPVRVGASGARRPVHDDCAADEGAGHPRWHSSQTGRSRLQAAVIHAARSSEVSAHPRRGHRRLLRRGSRAAARDGEHPDSRRVVSRSEGQGRPRLVRRHADALGRHGRRWPRKRSTKSSTSLPPMPSLDSAPLRARHRSTFSPRMPRRRWRSSSTCCGRRASMRSDWTWRGRSGSRRSSDATTRPKRSRLASGRG